MASSGLLRWGLILSTLAVAVAVALRLQQQQQQQQPLQDAASFSSPTVTHCYKGGVRTQDDDLPLASCFSVVDGIFSRVLSGKEVEVLEQEDESSVTHHEGYVIPGLWDGHGHLLQYGEFLHSVDLFGAETLVDVRARIKAYLQANPGTGSKDNWVRGVGWDQTAFGRMPTANDIEQDPELKGIYMMLDRIDVHCSWVSQSVLDLLTPEDLPEEVPGGEIVRDPGMGVFCDNAMDIVSSRWPKPTDAMKAEQVRSAMAQLNKVGLVGMHDAGITPGNIALYNDLAAENSHKGGWWTVRVYGMLECDKRNTFCPDDAAAAVLGPVTARDDNARFLVRSVKLFADGALGSWGSAMIDPYSDHPWTSGSLLINATELTSLATSWAAEGFQVNIHAIGDLANRYAIDALEAALRQQCPDVAVESLHTCQSAHRFRIEHAQIVHPDDQARLLRLGIHPSVQPTHATSDFKYAESRLGSDRLRTSAYLMKSLLPARPVLGSDFPVEPPNPFHGMYAAIARKSPQTGLGPGEDPVNGFLTEEALGFDEALRGFTEGPAYGGFLEGKAGVIRQGAFADWVVLDTPIDSLNTEDLRTLEVRETWVGGTRVYRR